MDKQLLWMIVIAIAIVTAGCDKGDRSYSLLSASEQFSQSTNTLTKIDILWMVDGSGTMANHQTNLADNFSSFISDFTHLNYDHHMAVASTDAWLREVNYNGGTCTSNPNPSQNPNTIYKSSADCANTLATFGQLTHFRDGDIYGAAGGTPGPRSGVYLLTSAMDPITLADTFRINVRTGTRGDGSREAGFQSLRAVLRRNADGSPGYNGETHTALSQFRRDDAFLAVIIVSDEEDQSRKPNGSSYSSTNDYVTSFKNFLDGYTGSTADFKNYNVNSIVIDDIDNCAYGLHEQATQGNRYVAIANATNGISASICSNNFSQQLTQIAQQIVTLSTRFLLSREPIPETIKVWVNGVEVPNSPSNGWIYVNQGDSHFIEFHGQAVPPQGANISVFFDPVAPLN